MNPDYAIRALRVMVQPVQGKTNSAKYKQMYNIMTKYNCKNLRYGSVPTSHRLQLLKIKLVTNTYFDNCSILKFNTTAIERIISVVEKRRILWVRFNKPINLRRHRVGSCSEGIMFAYIKKNSEYLFFLM